MRTALSFLVKNRGAKRPGFYIEMVRLTILRRVYLIGLQVNCRNFRLPEKQVIRNGAIKKTAERSGVFFLLRSGEARAVASGARVVAEGSTRPRVRVTPTDFSRGGASFCSWLPVWASASCSEEGSGIAKRTEGALPGAVCCEVRSKLGSNPL